MNILPATPITTAIASPLVTQTLELSAAPRNLTAQANFVYGSGGTTVDAYLQTSVDGGLTWIDIANFHFTTASERYVFNLNAQTPVTTEYTPTDGSLASNTAKDGILGRRFRVKYESSGTYGGTTTLQIDVDNDLA